jgi:hypothetical protein
MKSIKSFLLLALAAGAGLSLSSCEKVLDKTNLASINGDLVFADSTLANLNLNYVYDQNLPGWFGQSGIGLGSVNPSVLTEESYGDNIYLQGNVQLNDVTDFGVANTNGNNYGKIRIINAFLRDVKNGTIIQKSKNRLRAQAQFFRAYRYFDLVRVYGGVPLLFVPLDAVGPDNRAKAFLPRNTTTDCLKAIVADLDSAIAVLPGKWGNSDYGRITRGAAAAFKARVLLTAASPQFNPSDDAAKWQAAFAASQQAQTLLAASGAALNASFDQQWFQEGGSNPEAVLVTVFNTSSGTNTSKPNGYDNATRPSYTGTSGGSNQPTWEMAKAFPMLDGKKPGDATSKYAYTDQLFYKNRDPRFDKTIAYNGATWPLNGNSSYKLWTYQAGGKSTEIKASNTGFYTRKAINPNLGIADAQYAGTDWIEIRYAEVLLNLAESACGVNNLTLAYDQLKAIRKRAGIEAGVNGLYGLPVGMSRAQMFDAILYERQIEFAFEGKRFWDLRRTKKLLDVMNTAVNRRHKLIITLKTTAPTPSAATFLTTRDNLNLDQVYTDYFTLDFSSNQTLLDTKTDPISYKSNYYFFAIPTSAINNNTNLLQNKDWMGGTFDPLQ